MAFRPGFSTKKKMIFYLANLAIFWTRKIRILWSRISNPKHLGTIFNADFGPGFLGYNWWILGPVFWRKHYFFTNFLAKFLIVRFFGFTNCRPYFWARFEVYLWIFIQLFWSCFGHVFWTIFDMIFRPVFGFLGNPFFYQI